MLLTNKLLCTYQLSTLITLMKTKLLQYFKPVAIFVSDKPQSLPLYLTLCKMM